jgi:hypothetical protein
VRYLPSLVVICTLVACGSAAPPPRPAAAHRAPQLVVFQRNGGLAATLDTVTVRRDGAAHQEKRYGGAGGRFEDYRLTTQMLARVRSGLARAARAGNDRGGSGREHGATYFLRFDGRAYTVHEGGVPQALRPVVAALEDVLDGLGRRS